ncbi:MAG: hypothetical protein V1779_00945 [bacterium]
MNKLVLVFVLLKLSSNLMLGLFDSALEQVGTFLPETVIENTEKQDLDTTQRYARVLSVDR